MAVVGAATILSHWNDMVHGIRQSSSMHREVEYLLAGDHMKDSRLSV